MNRYKQDYVKQAAEKIVACGFKVTLAESGTHGYYTDETARRVVSFEYDLCGEIAFSGNYISESNGTGWRMCEASPETLTKDGLNGMLYANSPFTCKSYTTEAQHLRRYGSSSKYTEFKINAGE